MGLYEKLNFVQRLKEVRKLPRWTSWEESWAKGTVNGKAVRQKNALNAKNSKEASVIGEEEVRLRVVEEGTSLSPVVKDFVLLLQDELILGQETKDPTFHRAQPSPSLTPLPPPEKE